MKRVERVRHAVQFDRVSSLRPPGRANRTENPPGNLRPAHAVRNDGTQRHVWVPSETLHGLTETSQHHPPACAHLTRQKICAYWAPSHRARMSRAAIWTSGSVPPQRSRCSTSARSGTSGCSASAFRSTCSRPMRCPMDSEQESPSPACSASERTLRRRTPTGSRASRRARAYQRSMLESPKRPGLPLTGGRQPRVSERLELALQLATLARRGQQLSDHGEPQPRPPLVDGRIFRLAHPGIPCLLRMGPP